MTKPTQSESEYFAKEEAEKKHRISEEQRRKKEAQDLEARKNLHYMKCPKCGDDLKTIRLEFVDVERCNGCEALVLDKGELEKIKAADKSVLKSLIDVFRKEK